MKSNTYYFDCFVTLTNVPATLKLIFYRHDHADNRYLTMSINLICTDIYYDKLIEVVTGTTVHALVILVVGVLSRL